MESDDAPKTHRKHCGWLRPIPAIFLYREASGAMYAYNILDGKQRLESLILFVGNQRADLQVKEIAKYFFDKKLRSLANFKINVGNEKRCLKDMEDGLFRDFRDYVIPTIEITLSEDNPSALDEMISLFVDINSYGEQVKRFDIVKAMSKDHFLKSAFSLISLTERRGKDVLYKSKKNDFTRVLQKLQVVDNLKDANSKVDVGIVGTYRRTSLVRKDWRASKAHRDTKKFYQIASQRTEGTVTHF